VSTITPVSNEVSSPIVELIRDGEAVILLVYSNGDACDERLCLLEGASSFGVTGMKVYGDGGRPALGGEEKEKSGEGLAACEYDQAGCRTPTTFPGGG